MKAVILAAGKGTRMRELTSALPKPMLRVAGKPILEHILEGIIAAGIHDVFIVTGFRADTIESYFGDGSKWNLRIAYGRQEVQDGTGKAAEPAKAFVGTSPFLLTYGDILVKPETYQQMIHRFNEGDFSGLITVTRGEDVTKGGLNFFDEQFCLKRIVEKPGPEQLEQLRRDGSLKSGAPVWYNAGIYIFKPALFDFTAKLKKSPRGEYELTDAINAMLSANLKIAGMEIQGRWVDVRDPEVLAKLVSSERRVFRPAVLPVFGFYFGMGLFGGIAASFPDTHFTVRWLAFLLLVAALVSALATFFIWRVGAEVLSSDGMQIWSIRGRRLLPWQDLVAIRPFPFLRLLYLRFFSEARGSRRVLIFQRQLGEFRRVVMDLVPKDNSVWRHLDDA